MAVDDVRADNGLNFCSDKFAELLAERAIKHRRTQPYRPQTNSKAERFNRTPVDEFLYARVFRSEFDRPVRLARWAHAYNCHRHLAPPDGKPHTAGRGRVAAGAAALCAPIGQLKYVASPCLRR